MKKLILAGFAAVLASTTFLITSCEKDQTTVTDSPADYNLVDIQTDLAFKEVDDAAVSIGILRRGNYPTITVDSSGPISVVKTMTIDYGPTPLLCADGNYRSGKLTARWTSTVYGQQDKAVEIELIGLKQNDFTYGPTNIIVNNNGKNKDGHQNWKITSSGKVYLSNGDSISWSGTRDRTWIEGESTPLDRSDDKFEITGTNNFTNRKGKNFNAIITTAVVADFSCEWRITKGIVNIVPTARPDWKMKLDYGDGSCSSTGTFTLGKKTHTFTKVR